MEDTWSCSLTPLCQVEQKAAPTPQLQLPWSQQHLSRPCDLGTWGRCRLQLSTPAHGAAEGEPRTPQGKASPWREQLAGGIAALA